jgi:hypothetical protein
MCDKKEFDDPWQCKGIQLVDIRITFMMLTTLSMEGRSMQHLSDNSLLGVDVGLYTSFEATDNVLTICP